MAGVSIGGYSFDITPLSSAGGGEVAPNTSVLYWDATTETISGSSNLTFNSSTNILTLGAGKFLIPDGAAATPSIAFAADTSMGLVRTAGGFGGLTDGGSYSGVFVYPGTGYVYCGRPGAFFNFSVDTTSAGGNISINGNSTIGWASGDAGAAPDTKWNRTGAGLFQMSSTGTNCKLAIKAGSSQSVNLQEWQDSSGTPLTSITKEGYVNIPDGDGSSVPSLRFGSDVDTGIGRIADGTLGGFANGAVVFAATPIAVKALAVPLALVDSAGNNPAYLNRDGANILAQRASTIAQTLRIYGTYTDTSNYERLSIALTGGTGAAIAPETAGTGADNLDLSLSGVGTGAVKVLSDAVFVGAGSGMPYGGFYGNDIAWTQASAVQNTWYDISDTDINDMPLNLVTHDGSGLLTLTKAGTYLIGYALDAEATAANKHLETGISISGTVNASGQNQFETHVANQELVCAGRAILTVTANATVAVSIRCVDAGTPNITVHHVELTAHMIGG